MKRVVTGILISLLLASSSFCQYLTVSRSANIKEKPIFEYQTIIKVDQGQILAFLDNGTQANGYYHVLVPDKTKSGWIYRSLVRRSNDPLPKESTTLSINNVVSTDITWTSKIPENYYEGTENLQGKDLKKALHNLIKGHKEYPYTSNSTDVWDILKETDRDPNTNSNVVLIYSGHSTDAAQEYNNGQGWEKEHVWSQSHGQFGREKGPGTDVQHLRPVEREFNGPAGKGNKDFDDNGQEFIYNDDLTGCLVTDSTWAPIPKFRGDVARMMFYMDVRYEGDDGYPNLELIDDYTMRKYKDKPVYGKLSTLLRWNQEDPVDNWERRRNDIIYEKYQGNRNPFIDHPEFVSRIWK